MSRTPPLVLCAIAGTLAAGNGAGNGDDPGAGSTRRSDTSVPQGVVLGHFAADAFAAEASTEDCTLSGGTSTTCHRLVIAGEPSSSPVGPFCPESITSTAEDGGLWFDGSGIVYDVDGEFIVELPTIYDDPTWQMYDEASGLVNVTDGQEGCDITGDPNVDADFTNQCVECTLETLGGGVERTVLIPVTPVPAEAPADIGRTNVGVALNGVLLGPPAPVDLILGSYTLGVFDDCGGHINPHEGYHYHGLTGCSDTVAEDDGHAPLLGYALDGYAIHALLDEAGREPTDLDGCRGESDGMRGYHYHTAAAGENLFIGCFHGETGSVDGNSGGGPSGPPPGGSTPEGMSADD